MKPILKQLLYLIISLAGVYAVFFILTTWNLPSRTVLDTGAPPALYPGSARQAVMDRGLLKSDAPKIIFVGSSNAREGFRPGQILNLPSNYEIHNMSLGASNLTQVKKVLELAYEVVPPQSHADIIFVLGLWYGHMVENAVRWENALTDIDNEKLRFGLYRKHKEEIRPSVPPEYFDSYARFLYPFLAFDNFSSNTKAKLKEFFEAKARGAMKGKGEMAEGESPRDLDAVIVTQEDKLKAFEFWKNYLGREDEKLNNEQLEVLLDLVQFVEAHKSRLVIVDMPLPVWHREGSGFFHDYEEKKGPYIAQALQSPNVTYMNMQDLNSDEDFYDSAHPRPRATAKWGQRVEETLKGIINN